MLKQLKLTAELKQRNKELSDLLTVKENLERRKRDLETALSEAETADDIALVEGQVSELENEVAKAGVEEKENTINAEITRIESELSDVEKRSKEVGQVKENKQAEIEKVRGVETMNKYQVREMLKTGEYYTHPDVVGFYEGIKNIRSVGGEGLTIPNIVVSRIFDIIGDYATLYPLVNKIRVGGTARILIDTDTTAATWVESTAALATGDVGTITNVDFDGYKIGKVTLVDNSILQDSIINIDDYVARKLARSIALGLNLAILKGTGSDNKQPDGILPSLNATNKTEADVSDIVNVVKKLALIDTGADSVGEIVCVMKRSTYYNRFLEFSIQVDSSGNLIGKLPNMTNPDILGMKVVFSNNMDEDTVLFGEFDKYTLVERESVTIARSEHVKFVEDQVAYRGLGRFDGKPTNKDAFVAVNLDEGKMQDLTVTSVASATATGKTKLTVAEKKMIGRTYQYKTHGTTAPTASYGDILAGWTAWNGVDELTITTTHKVALCEVGADGKVKRYGTVTATSKE